MRRFAALVAVMLGLGWAVAGTLPVPPTLIALDSEEGADLLFGAEARADFPVLSAHFVTQDNLTFCGPASIAMVLNALDLPRPASENAPGFELFDQENIYTASTEAAKPKSEILQGGMTLEELGGFLEAHKLAVTVQHAENTDLDVFRAEAVADLGERDRFVLVNYERAKVGQEEGGHISPLAAYDEDTDRFLVLDVSRYKYPPVWVEAEALFEAMDTRYAPGSKNSRGYLVVAR